MQIFADFLVVAAVLCCATIGQTKAGGGGSGSAGGTSISGLIISGCDSTRLIRCQQDILRDMQVVGLNGASVQYPISGPPYSPAAAARQREQQLAGTSTCRLVRANLDCLLSSMPNCYETGLQAAQNGDIVLRGKRFLEQNGCNEPDPTWQTTFCYRAPEIRGCEERYDFTNYGRATTLSVVNVTSCLTYQAFKHCVESHLRLNCKVPEMDMVNEYLIDRAGELSWRCPTNQTSSSQLLSGNYHHRANTNPYALSNPSGSLLSPSAYGSSSSGGVSSYGSNYEQRPLPTYAGSSQSVGSSLAGHVPVREQAWERFRSPLDDTRFGISRHPGLIGASGTGEVFDRLVAANAGFDVESSECPIRAAPFARECEDTLLDQQRLARDSRDGNELQKRTCCSLFQFRDCITRVVLDRCADSSAAAVEILMGTRRREMAITCRGFNRDLCSGALASSLASPFMMVAANLVALFMAFKSVTH